MTSDAPVDTPATVPPERSEGKGAAVWREIKGLIWVLLAVLAFHSLVAKPFYIPSESMMPDLLKGDRLVVSKYPYGWSWDSFSFHILPHWKGRVFGHMPARGDIVIVTPPNTDEDWIKRVIGVPGDTIEVRGGRLILNGKMVPWQKEAPTMIPVDANLDCAVKFGPQFEVIGRDGKQYCRLPVVRETLPTGVSYDTIDLTPNSEADNYGPYTVPAGHVFLMGDNRDDSADSRVPAWEGGLGGAVPWENIGGRAEFITFSLRGEGAWLNPISWLHDFRGGRAGNSLRPVKG